MAQGSAPEPSSRSSQTDLQPPFPPFSVRDGRYLGSNGRWWVELRVDAGGSGVISVDVHAEGPSDTLIHRSARTPRGRRIDPGDGSWPVEWTLGRGAAEQGGGGWLALRPVPDVADSYLLRLHRDADGEAAAVRVVRAGDALRELGVEVEVEDGVVPPRLVVYKGEYLDADACLRRAGFAVQPVGAPSSVARTGAGGWHGADVLAQLNAAMARAAQAPLGVPAWEAHLLLLSKSDRPNLMGVMFDFVDDLPRQGAAVFVDEIRARYPADVADRRIVQTIVHELGHVLNLSHRFSIGRWDSTSFMNYDWWYRGGRSPEQYQQDFAFTFDADELEFLRHGARRDVIPGGAPFGSDPYWLMAGEGDRPYVKNPAELRLWLTPPDRTGPGGPFEVTLGDPVFLGVSIGNAGGGPVVLPREVLDVKAGQLELTVEPVGGAVARSFTPVMRRCYDASAPRLVRLDFGQSLHDNVNLAFASDGAPFPEPGEYTITPSVQVPSGRPDEPGQVIRVVGRPLRIVVTAPAAGADATARDVLLQPTLGVTLSLASTAGRAGATAALSDVRGRLRRDRVGARVLAAIDRATGIEAYRRADFAGAEQQLEASLAAVATFDPHTAEHTRRLLQQTRARQAEQARQAELQPPAVIVDLALRTGPDTATRRVAGALRVNRQGEGWGVLVRADDLPPAAMDDGTDVDAVVTLSLRDGLTERIPVDLIHVAALNDHPEVALLFLPRPVPAEPTRALSDEARARVAPTDTLLGVLARETVLPEALASLSPSEAESWEAAADLALRDGGGALPSRPAVLRSLRCTIDDVAGWCRWIRACEEDRPADPDPDGAPYPFDGGHPFEPQRGPHPGKYRDKNTSTAS